jgi:hypothetical protein
MRVLDAAIPEYRHGGNRFVNEFRMGKFQLAILSALAATASASAAANSNWSIVEDTAAADNTPQFSAGLIVGDAALILRCREERTEAAFSTRDTYLGGENVMVRYRLDQQEPVKETWRSSVNGHAAFAPKAEDFIRALPDNGRVFIRAIAADGTNKDANFQLAGVSEIKEKIARACNWANVTDESTTGTIKQLQSQ